MTDLSHLNALSIRLSHERARFAADASEVRAVWIAQIEREIEGEKRFLGITDDVSSDMSDDELLAELGV